MLCLNNDENYFLTNSYTNGTNKIFKNNHVTN